MPHHDPAIILQPGEEPFRFPASFLAAPPSGYPATVVRLVAALAAMRSTQFHPLLGQGHIQRITINGVVANQMRWSISDTTCGDRCFSKGDFMRWSRCTVDGARKTKARDQCHDLGPVAPRGRSTSAPPVLATATVPSIKQAERSSPPRSRTSLARADSIRSNVPVCPPSWKRRWHGCYDGYRSGTSFHGAPVRRIHRMPLRISRSFRPGRPRPSSRRGTGINGAITFHCSSVNSSVCLPANVN
ncbi:MAG: hypothetical protein KatS3mg057_1210 [Herpetosiphonaceae bacterium]|nr:MAG: hypothetical protein KatS3mg057_1210 [Herpetosiphonaceae bacterium]